MKYKIKNYSLKTIHKLDNKVDLHVSSAVMLLIIVNTDGIMNYSKYQNIFSPESSFLC